MEGATVINQAATAENRATRVIIVDDHPVVREGLKALLSRVTGFEVCGDGGNRSEALTLIDTESPDLAIVDMMLGEENGLDLIRSIKEIKPSVRILACSMCDDLLYAEQALAAGAMGYINKRTGLKWITEALRMVMAGEFFLNETVKQRIIGRHFAGVEFRRNSTAGYSANQEPEVFRLIGQGMRTLEIGGMLSQGEYQQAFESGRG